MNLDPTFHQRYLNHPYFSQRSAELTSFDLGCHSHLRRNRGMASSILTAPKPSRQKRKCGERFEWRPPLPITGWWGVGESLL